MRAGVEQPRRVGLALFWIAIGWAVLWGVVGGFTASSAMNSLTPAELEDSIWAITGPLMLTYALSPALGAFLAGIGAMLYSGARGWTVGRFGLGVLFGLALASFLVQSGYVPLLFGIGGTLILLFFIGILWLWAKERAALKGASSTATDFKLVGYVFMVMATWFTCGIGSQPFLDALEGQEPTNPIHIMLLLTLGWLFLFLSHYTAHRQQITARQ